MKRGNVYITSFIFVLLTVIKLLFPERTEGFRKELVSFIEWDMNYRELAVEVGSRLSEEHLYEVFGFVKDESEDLPIENITLVDTDEFYEYTIPQTQTIVPTEGAEYNDRVTAFMEAQSEFVGYELPERVSFDALVLPFTYQEPVTGVTSSGFGYRIHPIDQDVSFHYGTDYGVEEGTPVSAFSDGQVAMVSEETGYGKYLIVRHADGWESLYAHCSEVSVVSGQYVGEGQRIALSGQTGRVTGPHLHFELRHNGYYTNPEFFF